MMKIIFSRKGFDSGSGGVPSPILPDGRMFSLPIPDKRSNIQYQDIIWQEFNVGDIVSDLTKGRVPHHYKAHLDPDLQFNSLSRLQGWKPILGQAKAAQGHLRNQKIEPGDIFLFFGLFQEIVLNRDRWIYREDSVAKHVIWGWLQIDIIVAVDSCSKNEYPWALYHPHFYRGIDRTNTIYFSKKQLSIPGVSAEKIKGAGVFEHFSKGLQLSMTDSENASVWELPGWFYPRNDRPPLTYHGDQKRWKPNNDKATLNSVPRGQEFVLDCHYYPEANDWIAGLLTNFQI